MKSELEEIKEELWGAIFFLYFLAIVGFLMQEQWVLAVFAFLPVAVWSADRK